MDQTSIKELAEQISSQLAFDWKVYFWILVLSFVGGSLGTFIFSYLKARGLQFATKSDFQQLLIQLTRTTEATEKIKTGLAHENWKAQKQWDFKRSTYQSLLESISTWQRTIHDALHSSIKQRHRGVGCFSQEDIQKISVDFSTNLFNAFSEINKQRALGSLVLDEHNVKKLEDLIRSLDFTNVKEESFEKDLGEILAQLVSFEREIVRLAKKDLLSDC